jgi:glycosyltransferase involved in cell wall biosynthesis
VICDNESSDDTLKTVEKYKELNPSVNITLSSIKDSGIYDAYNRGISLSSGKYLFFIGSDDVLSDNYVLSKVIKEMENNYDVIYGDVYWGDSNKLYDGEFSKDKLLFKNICHQAIFYKKDLFSKHPNYNTNYIVYADYDLNIRLFNNPSVKTKYIDCVISRYNTTGFSSHANDPKFNLDKLNIIKNNFPEYYADIFVNHTSQLQLINNYKNSLYRFDEKNLIHIFYERFIDRIGKILLKLRVGL